MSILFAIAGIAGIVAIATVACVVVASAIQASDREWAARNRK